MSPELYFLRYAFPCAFLKLQQGRLTQKVYDSLHDAVLGRKRITKNMLAKIFPLALGHIESISKEKKASKWSVAAIREYFWEKHDDVIEAGEGFYANAPRVLCELCRVLPAEVQRRGGNWAVVKFTDGKKRSVLTELVPGLKKGDRVMVHYGYIVEKLAAVAE